MFTFGRGDFKIWWFMRVLQLKRLYIPALSILAVVILMLILISISTYRNLEREEKAALTFLYREGSAILHTLEAGARAGMIMPEWEEDSIENLILETGKNENIAYVYLIDSQGIVIHHSNPSFESMSSAWHPQLDNEDQVQSRVRKLTDGAEVYDLAKRFSPRQSLLMNYDHKDVMGHGQNMAVHQHSDNIIILGLTMTAFEEARRSDIHHAVIMAAILLALGSGALFFIFVIQNYYLVDRTLKQTQDYTRQVVASMANGLLSINPDGKIASYNLLALELLDLKESEVREKNLKSVFDFKETGIDDILSGCQSVIDREISHRQKSGELLPMVLSVTPIRDEGEACTGAVIVLRDLREIKQLEKKVRQSEKLAAIGRLAAGVAHEIRNPLSSIRGFARFLAHALSDRSQEREYAEIMVKEVDRINRVVNDLLTFAQPMKPNREPTDISKIIKHTIRLMEVDARSRDVLIHRNISPDLDKLSIDGNQITQALINLILNALQELDTGGIIEVGAEVDHSGNQINIWVEDNGSGIAHENKGKIFDPFFTTREKGTGLGLAIVHKIAENHGGEIRVDSPLPSKNQGCRFTIILPIKRSGRGRTV
ncbi:MAG: PAS domain-containing protein [Desulfobacteraceae bacterium]|nr:MAG: PAS domain-containing protein [Desulfobacteraceae bacterium]